MSLLLDALRRLEVEPRAKFAPTAPRASDSPATPPAGAGHIPRAVRVEEPAAPSGQEPPLPPPAVAWSTASASDPSPPAETFDSVETTAALEMPRQAAAATASSAGFDRRPANEPPTWEAAYDELKSTAAEIYVSPSIVEVSEASVESAAVDTRPPATRPVETRPLETQSVETRPLATQISPADSSVELPRPRKIFDCRGLAAALRRLRPSGGRIVFVSVGTDHSTGTPEWSSELADELSDIGALPVDRFASGALTIDGSEASRLPCDGYRLYFVGAEFAAARGAHLRTADTVVLVVQEGATSPKAAEVVQGALAAQHVKFAGFVYVAR